jgi:VWFA-related protein
VVLDAGSKRDLTAFSVDSYNPPESISPSVASPTPKATPQPSGSAQKLRDENPADGRSIGLLFDDINTSTGDLAHAKIAAARFIREAVQGGDNIGVFTTSSIGATPFSSDNAVILAEMAKVKSHPLISASGLAQCPRMTAYEAYQILNRNPSVMQAKVIEACQCSGAAVCGVGDITPSSLFDPTSRFHDPATIDIVESQARQTWEQARLASQATLDGIKSSLDQLASRPGRRMLLLASAGFLSSTLDEQLDAITNLALRTGVVINSLDAKGLYAESPGPPINESVETTDLPLGSTVFQIESLGDRLDDLDSAMARFAESTGGLLFRNNNDLDLGFRRLGLLPGCIYLLGFPPAEDGKYHKIKVELRSASHDFLQVRPGYFAPTNVSSRQPIPAEKLDALISGTDERADFPAVISEDLGAAGAGR